MKAYYQEDKIELYLGDCRELAPKVIADHSVDLIFTDPPYPKEYHYCYEFLAKEAARVLKPDGFLIAYAGPYWKQRVMDTLAEYLEYYYDFILLHSGNTSILWPRRIITGYKDLLCYTHKNATPLPVTNVLGKYVGTGSDKRYHGWGQDALSARYYIDVFSRPGDLVVDYFLGAGTFGEVAKGLDRRFIGFEIEERSMEISSARVSGTVGPIVKGIQKETDYILGLCNSLESSTSDDISLKTASDSGTMLSPTGEYYFRSAIPGLQSIAPQLFYAQYYVPTSTDMGYTNDQATDYGNRLAGTDLETGINNTGALLGMSGENFIFAVFALICLCVIGVLAWKGWGVEPGTLVSGVILIAGGIEFGKTLFIVTLVCTLLGGIFIFFTLWLKRA